MSCDNEETFGLPNGDKAFIDQRKITEYCLNMDHVSEIPGKSSGRDKARKFFACLGLTKDDAEILEAELRKAAVSGKIVETSDGHDGAKNFKVEWLCVNGTKAAYINCRWQILKNEDFPRLTSAWVK